MARQLGGDRRDGRGHRARSSSATPCTSRPRATCSPWRRRWAPRRCCRRTACTSGVGAGWMREEFEQTGQDYTNRGKRLDEMIPALRALWKGGWTEHHGEYYDFGPLMIEPAPSRRCRSGWVVTRRRPSAAPRPSATGGSATPTRSTRPRCASRRCARRCTTPGVPTSRSRSSSASTRCPTPDVVRAGEEMGVTGLICVPWFTDDRDDDSGVAGSQRGTELQRKIDLTYTVRRALHLSARLIPARTGPALPARAAAVVERGDQRAHADRRHDPRRAHEPARQHVGRPVHAEVHARRRRRARPALRPPRSRRGATFGGRIASRPTRGSRTLRPRWRCDPRGTPRRKRRTGGRRRAVAPGRRSPWSRVTVNAVPASSDDDTECEHRMAAPQQRLRPRRARGEQHGHAAEPRHSRAEHVVRRGSAMVDEPAMDLGVERCDRRRLRARCRGSR